MAVWNLGSINIDHVYRLDSLPRPGETLAARQHGRGIGGKGANQSLAAAKAGARTHHLGAVGADAGWLLEGLRSSGIETDAIHILPDTPTGHAIIMVDDAAENAIVIEAGANRALEPGWLEGALTPMRAGDTLLIQNETNLQAMAARLGRAAGARVIYSAAPFQLDALQEVLPHVSILALNEGEAQQLFAAMPGDLPIEQLLITRGAQGVELRDLRKGQTLRQPAFAVQPVDTTGAGDCFAGYFAAALDRGDDAAQALRLASAAAAIQVTRHGAGDAMPLLAEVQAFLAKAPPHHPSE